jgi:hypothetical protein
MVGLFKLSIRVDDAGQCVGVEGCFDGRLAENPDAFRKNAAGEVANFSKSNEEGFIAVAK